MMALSYLATSRSKSSLACSHARILRRRAWLGVRAWVSRCLVIGDVMSFFIQPSMASRSYLCMDQAHESHKGCVNGIWKAAGNMEGG